MIRRRSIERKEEGKETVYEGEKAREEDRRERTRCSQRERGRRKERERDERGEGRRENSFSRRMRVDLRADSHQRIGHDLGSP